MGVTALQKTLGSTRAEAQKFHDDYFIQFPQIGAYLDEVRAFAEKNGYNETLFGRRRYYPDLKSRLPYIRATALRMAVNFPFQGTSADIIKLAMKNAYNTLVDSSLINKAHLVLQIHDELIYEIEDVVLEKAVKAIKEAMENVMPPKYLKGRESVPIKVHVSAGNNWGEMKKIAK